MHIIFDLGGVVFSWKPEEILTRAFKDPQTRLLARREIFEHPDWAEMDRGKLSYREAGNRARERTGLPAREISGFFRWVPLSLVGMPPSIDLLRRLKSKGHRLYYLSNMHQPAMKYLEEAYNFWDVFEGGVFSCRVGWAKPEREIYYSLFKQEGLKAEEAVFIDDMPVNLEPATEMGLKTILFEDAARCEDQLRVLGF